MTRGTSGRTSSEPFASYDQGSSSWRTSQDLSSTSESSSVTWPRSGSMRSGRCFERPKLALPIDATVSSSSPGPLPKTPTAQLATNGGSQHPDKRKQGGHGPTLADEVEWLLPTPSASNPNDGEDLENWKNRREAVKAKGVNGNGFGMPLSIAVRLLPTPTARDWKNGKSNLHDKNSRPLGEVALVAGDNTGKFGKYAPAVDKWEAVLGRQAPDPTLPDGRNGSHRLNSKFALWMQAADDLDLTGFTRKQELMAAGNAVNHVQAEAAIRGLLARREQG